MVDLKTTLRQVGSRQGPCFSITIRVVIGIFRSDTDTDKVFVQLNQYSQILRRQSCLVGSKYGSMIANFHGMHLAPMNEIRKEKFQS